MFEASVALQKMEGMKKIKSTSFHQYSWNSEVETIWISLIGWHHKTSNTHTCCGSQPGIMPSHIWIVEHDPFQWQGKLYFIRCDFGRSVQVGQDRSVISHNHNFTVLSNVNDVIIKYGVIFVLAVGKSEKEKNK